MKMILGLLLFTISFNVLNGYSIHEQLQFIPKSKLISNKCKNQVLEYLNNFSNQTLSKFKTKSWAVQMMDAQGKLNDGIFDGNLVVWGSKRACLKTKRINWENRDDDIYGRYIQIWKTKNPIDGWIEDSLNTSIEESIELELNPFKVYRGIGFCLPDSCTSVEIATALKANFPGYYYVIKSEAKSDVIHWSNYDYVFLISISILGILSLLGTFYNSFWDVTNTSNHVFGEILRKFSIIENLKSLFEGTPTHNDIPKKVGYLECLDGIRFLSMTWVLMGHTLSHFGTVVQLKNPIYILDFLKRRETQVFLNAFVSVDSFFFMSGLLVTLLTLRQLKKTDGKLNWIIYYFHRYLRLTIPYAFIVLFCASVLQHLMPRYKPAMNQVQSCQNYGWQNLLYINNFFPKENVCLGVSWYLANDMQIFLITPLIIYPLWKWPKTGLGLLMVYIAASLTTLVTLQITHEDWPATVLLDSPDQSFMFNNYIKPWCRISPYLIGMLTGLFVFQCQGKKFKLPLWINIIGWILAFSAGLVIIYGYDMTYLYKNYENNITDRETNLKPHWKRVLFGGLHRGLWGSALGWIVFTCTTGNCKLINDLLSWDAFKPLGKLSFTIYLIHTVIIEVWAYHLDRTVMMSNLIIIFGIFYNLMVSIFFAVIFHIIIESPLLQIEKFILIDHLNVSRNKMVQ